MRNQLYNESAGRHPLPRDKREVSAVLRATERCFDLHPYFLERYGQRGRAFANSDGGYLTTLCSLPGNELLRQVLWLAGILAVRGMPRWLMEIHLDLLCEELSLAVPGRDVRYRKLAWAAGILRQARREQMAQRDFDALAEDFTRESGDQLKNAGALIVAAVCDEGCGLADSVPALNCWLGDPQRFSAKWCVSVDETLHQARLLVAQGKQAV